MSLLAIAPTLRGASYDTAPDGWPRAIRTLTRRKSRLNAPLARFAGRLEALAVELVARHREPLDRAVGTDLVAADRRPRHDARGECVADHLRPPRRASAPLRRPDGV